MTCVHCGTDNAPGASFCNGCGAAIAAAAEPQPGAGMPGQGMPPPDMPPIDWRTQPGPTRTSGMAIAGFVLSFFCGLLGLIFSIMGQQECKNSRGEVGGEGLAIAGIIISIVNMLLGLAYAL